MMRRRKLQRFSVLQSHCEWLDAQARVGINDNSIVQAAVSEFLYEIQEEKRQWWITGARAELPARTPTIDVIVNAALSQFKSRHHAEFLEAPGSWPDRLNDFETLAIVPALALVISSAFPGAKWWIHRSRRRSES